MPARVIVGMEGLGQPPFVRILVGCVQSVRTLWHMLRPCNSGEKAKHPAQQVAGHLDKQDIAVLDLQLQI